MSEFTLGTVSVSQKTHRPLRRDAERNRQRVIEAARELFASRGLEANLNDVAHHAGLGVGTVYRRFPTKQELIEAVFEDGVNRLTEFADSALRHDDSWEGFVWFLEQMCEATATDRGAREIVFSRTYSGVRVDAARDRLAPKVANLVKRAQKDGYLRPELSQTDIPIFGLLAGTVSEFAGHVDAQLWRRYVAILIDGIRNRGDHTRLEISALEEEELEAAMQGRQTAGPR